MGGAAYAEGDGRIERPHEPDILLRFMALAQQRAASQLLAPPQATVGDVSSVGKGLRQLPDLSGTRWFASLSDSMPLERSLGLRHGSPAARHSTLWGVAQGGGTTWASWSAGHHELQGIVGCSSQHGGGAGYGGQGQHGAERAKLAHFGRVSPFAVEGCKMFPRTRSDLRFVPLNSYAPGEQILNI